MVAIVAILPKHMPMQLTDINKRKTYFPFVLYPLEPPLFQFWDTNTTVFGGSDPFCSSPKGVISIFPCLVDSLNIHMEPI